jgi:hypothetical protein
MLKVEWTNFTISDVLETVGKLRKEGYQQGKDFDFAYFPEKLESDDFSYTVKEDRRVEFTFYDDELAFLFKLKTNQ